QRVRMQRERPAGRREPVGGGAGQGQVERARGGKQDLAVAEDVEFGVPGRLERPDAQLRPDAGRLTRHEREPRPPHLSRRWWRRTQPGCRRRPRRASRAGSGSTRLPACAGRWPRAPGCGGSGRRDRKSTRLNSSHVKISYAVFCLKKKKTEV